MTNSEAILRLKEKIRYTNKLISERPDDARQNFYRALDLEAFALCIAALEYTEAMAEYEASAQ